MTKTFMPGMPNISPEMLRQASQQLGQMDPETIKRMQQAAASQFGGLGGAPQQPGLFRNHSTPSPQSSNLNQNQHQDIKTANKLKDEGAKFYQDKQYERACEKYYEAINTIKFSDEVKNNQEARQIEIACRLNVALCKQVLEEHNAVIDQCQQVLDYEPENWKACFRLSNAMLKQSKGKPSNVKAIYGYMKNALKGNPGDQKVKELHDQVKKLYEDAHGEEKKNTEEVKQSPKIEDYNPGNENYAFVSNGNQTFQSNQPRMPQQFTNLPEEEKAKLIKENSERLKQMDDNQLKSMVDMMKSNKDLMKNMYRAQGMDMSDEMLETMTNMMTPEMLKSASEMMAQNPNLLNQMPMANGVNNNQQQQQNQQQILQQRQQTTSNDKEESKHQDIQAQSSQSNRPMNPMSMMNNMMGNRGMMDMMNNPMIQQMMSNPDLMKQAASMMGGDPSQMQSMMSNTSLSGLMNNPEMI